MKTIEELFSDLRKKRQEEFNGIRNSFALDGIWDNVVEKYSEKAHFIYEVLQNADDVGATWAKFELYQDCLVFRHNGSNHFNITPSDSEKEDYKQGRLGSLNAITATSKSTKTENSIGKFGVGFKAVFRYTKTPRIYDKDIRFSIHDYIVPERLSEDFPGRKEETETVFVFPFDREPTTDAVYVVPDKATCYAEIKNRLEKLKMPTLFLSTLSKVEFVCKNGSIQDGPSSDVASGVYSVKKFLTKEWQFNADGKRPQTSVMVLQNKKTLNGTEAFNDDLVMLSRGDGPGKKYCLCYKLDANGKIAPLNGFDAFCFFPTQHHTGLPFLVHAPFQLNDAREMLCEDSEHNKALIDNLRKLFADSFVYLQRIWETTEQQYYDDGLLDLLPLHRNETQQIKEFEPFFVNESSNPATLKQDHPVLWVFQTESVLPTDDGYTAKAHAYFAETGWIVNAFSTEDLRLLLNDEKANWAFPSTRKDKSGSADKGKSSFVEQTVCRTVDSTFIRQRLSEEIIRNCYNRLGENWLLRLHGRIINEVKENEEKKKFCQCPIFLDSDGNVCSALNADGRNILFLPSETGEPVPGFTTVLPSSVRDPNSPTAKLLCETCKATRPTKKDAVGAEVKYLLKNELEESDHLLAFQVIAAELDDLSSNDRVEVISELKMCNFYGKKSNNDVCLLKSSELYFREDNLVRYFSACPEVGFLDLDKYRKDLEEQLARKVEALFLELGVERLPRKKNITYTGTDKFDQEYKNRNWRKNEQRKPEEWVEEEFDGMLAAINFLDKVQLNNGVKETCIAVWQVLVKLVHKYGENGFLNEGKHHYYRKGKWYNDTEPAPNYLLHRLQTAKWLLSKDARQLVSAQETNVQSVLDVYAGNTPQEVALRKIIGLNDNAETRLMSELMALNPRWASALDQIIKRDRETVGGGDTGQDATVETGRAVNQDEGLEPAEVKIDRNQWPLGTGPDVRGPFDRIPQGTVSWVSEVEPFIKGDVTIAGTQIRRAKFRIPPYQRRFAWKEHDVRLLCRDLLKTNGSSHYHLGTIILHRKKASDGEIWDVVDGQQRLTNIMAILKAPVFDSNLMEDGTIRMKQFSRRDYEMVESILEEYGEDDKETIKNRLKSCTLAFVAVGDIAEAFQLFGTQNGRGKPLTPVNLLKAYHYREMNADFEQWTKERKKKIAGDTTEEQLKKDFDREVRFSIEKSWESTNGEDASTASSDGKLLSHVFGEYLFRIRNWTRGKFPTESFGNRDIGEFKGVTIRSNEDRSKRQLPLQNCAVLRKGAKTTEDSFIARRGLETEGFMPFMSICQTIVNGEDFFHYAETYATAYKHVFKENTVPEFFEFYKTNCSPSQHNKGGAMYARHIFEALCLFCYDLFGGEGLKACYQALFCCAYFERVSQSRVLYRKCGATFAPRAIEVMSRNFTIEDVRQGLNDLASEAKNEIRKSGYLENLDQSQLTAGQKMQKAALKIIIPS